MAGSDWQQIAAASTDDELREWILTGFRDGKPFTPYVPTIAWPPVGRVLDFGCGLGRNFPFLLGASSDVTGFDLPPMIARCRTLAPVPAHALEDDWETVRRQRFDLVFASLVLQHVPVDIVRARLAEFAGIAPLVYLLTRSDSDFGENLLDLVAAVSSLLPVLCVEVDHDPETHQLRVLGRPSFDEARRGGPGRHYELLCTAVG
jgi:SAM-dependent methyltransferase